MPIKQAVIVAGGKGERLKPLTEDRPKPMVLVNDKPFLEYLVELIRWQGIQEIVLLLGYLPNKVIEYFGDGSRFGVRITYHISPTVWLNGTRIRDALGLYDDLFLLMYCDQYWPLNLPAMIDFYTNKNKPALMTVYNNFDGRGEYGNRNNLKIANDYSVHHYGTLTEDKEMQGLDIGYFILNKKVLKLMPKDDFSFQDTFLPKLIERRELMAYRSDKHYCTITDHGLLNAAETYLKNNHKKSVLS